MVKEWVHHLKFDFSLILLVLKSILCYYSTITMSSEVESPRVKQPYAQTIEEIVRENRSKAMMYESLIKHSKSDIEVLEYKVKTHELDNAIRELNSKESTRLINLTNVQLNEHKRSLNSYERMLIKINGEYMDLSTPSTK
jgi:hypothetical protein